MSVSTIPRLWLSISIFLVILVLILGGLLLGGVPLQGTPLASLTSQSLTSKLSIAPVVYFCPQDHCADALIERINAAQKTMDIAIYSFTLDGIANAVVRAKERGVSVRVIFDADQSTNAYSVDEKLAAQGVVVKRRNGAGYMHNKFTVIDDVIVATGSFNYSDNANTKNEENLIFIDDANIAQQYTHDFEDIWSRAQ